MTKRSDIIYIDEMQGPSGTLTLETIDDGLLSVLWACVAAAEPESNSGARVRKPNHPILKAAKLQITEYMRGERKEFSLPLAPIGTQFQLRAWQVLRTIPYGKTISYEQQALQLGNANYSRAVGAANGKNPLSIVVPCHRVIGKDGSLTGFAGGLDTKAALLALEQGCQQRKLFA